MVKMVAGDRRVEVVTSCKWCYLLMGMGWEESGVHGLAQLTLTGLVCIRSVPSCVCYPAGAAFVTPRAHSTSLGGEKRAK